MAAIAALLAVSGVKALLIGVGFTEESEAFVLPAELGPAGCAAGLAGLNAFGDDGTLCKTWVQGGFV